MDQIIIRDLEVFYRVGVPEAERAHPQRLLLSLELDHPFARAAAEDDLNFTIDYSSICRRLLQLGENRSWKLIETLAVEIAETVLKEFRPFKVQVVVEKFILPETRCVAVRVSRMQPTKLPHSNQ